MVHVLFWIAVALTAIVGLVLGSFMSLLFGETGQFTVLGVILLLVLFGALVNSVTALGYIRKADPRGRGPVLYIAITLLLVAAVSALVFGSTRELMVITLPFGLLALCLFMLGRSVPIEGSTA